MEPNKIPLLIELLGQMKNPTPKEFNLITTEFNKYKKDNNTNIPPSKNTLRIQKK
jgi:hypothetical protein